MMQSQQKSRLIPRLRGFRLPQLLSLTLVAAVVLLRTEAVMVIGLHRITGDNYHAPSGGGNALAPKGGN